MTRAHECDHVALGQLYYRYIFYSSLPFCPHVRTLETKAKGGAVPGLSAAASSGTGPMCVGKVVPHSKASLLSGPGPGTASRARRASFREQCTGGISLARSAVCGLRPSHARLSIHRAVSPNKFIWCTEKGARRQ